MKKFILAAAVALLSSTAIAQEAIDRTPNALPAQNFGIIAESRAFLPLVFPAFTTSTSVKYATPLAGVVQEMWIQPQNANGSIDRNTWFYLSISRRNAGVQPICQANIRTAQELGGNAVSGDCLRGVAFAEGDALIVSAQPLSTVTSVAVTVTLRIADR